MFHVFRLVLIVSVLSACTLVVDKPALSNGRHAPVVIFDTDFGGDADDLGAVAMLHYYMDRGMLDVAAMVSWSNEAYAIPALAAVNQFYGRPNLRLGLREVDTWRTDWNYSKSIAERFPFAPSVAERAESAVAVYRDVLAAAEQNSVTIITVGPLANIQTLLNSAPDAFSPLNGADLVEEKVDRFIIMGGQFPEGVTANGPEWNFDGNMLGVTQEILETITRPIVFSGYEVGETLRYGAALNQHPKETPLYVGYKYFSEHAPWMKDDFKGSVLDNASFDQTAVMVAALGDDQPYWTLSAPGTLSTGETGIGTWKNHPDGRHRYMILTNKIEATITEIATAMTH